MATQPLRIWAQEWATTLDTNLLPKLSQHLSVKVEKDVLGWDWQRLHTKLRQSLSNGTAPDVIEIGTTWTSRLAQERVLLNITKFANNRIHAASNLFTRMLSTCRHATQVDQYYALPMLADLRILFYNDELLHPYIEAHPDAFKSWQDFEALCLALKDQLPNRVFAWSLGMADSLHDCFPWVWSAGGDFVSMSGQVMVDSDNTQRAFRWLVNLILTGCAPLPPDYKVQNKDGIRSLFADGQVAVMTGSYWMMPTARRQPWVKAALHPPDIFPATFAGGSNLAIVRKYEEDENDPKYDQAKALVEQLLNVESQLQLSEAIGKLPCNIEAWRELRRREQAKHTRDVLDAFEDALCYTVDRTLPSLPNLADIEQALKAGTQRIWEQVGQIVRDQSDDSTESLSEACAVLIRDELTQTRRQIEPLLIGELVIYSAQQVKIINMQPPEHFDVWLEVSDASVPDGNVYIKDRGLIGKGIGKLLFGMLHALVHAPGRSLTEEELVRLFWRPTHRNESKRWQQLALHHARVTRLVSLMNQGIDATPKHFEPLQHALQELGFAPARSPESANPIIHFQREVGRFLQEECETIADIIGQADYNQARDKLRHAAKDLDKVLGAFHGQRAIRRPQPDRYDLALDPELTIAVVAP